MTRLRAGIIGAGGYTGSELIRLIDAHPHLELTFVAAREKAGKTLAEVVPSTEGVPGLGEMVLESLAPEGAAELSKRIDVIFASHSPAAKANLVGSDEENMMSGDLWPSDHAGVVPELTFSR